ncbi:hypothetical protein AB0F81_17450 [Actinoplanes sp. NPDC024001]|uniref:hypothetical protein n=1 Tax=Actinoplanes sp. NPDC024001 TaxID=3154598 RepID=UPI0033D896B8
MEGTRRYGRRDLIDAYLAAQGGKYGGYLPESSTFNAALLVHHRAMLAGLERLFEIRLAHEGMSEFGHRTLFMLFTSTVRSLLGQTAPWSDFLEAGLLHRTLEATPVNARVMAASDRIWMRMAESREDHLDILDALLTVFLGDRAERTFSAADLRAIGVGVEPPRLSDFSDD